MGYADFSCELNHFLRRDREKGAREPVAIGLLHSLAGDSTKISGIGLALSTVWRQVATGERWLRANGGYGLFVAIRCQAVGGCELSLHRLATGGYGRQGATYLTALVRSDRDKSIALELNSAPVDSRERE